MNDFLSIIYKKAKSNKNPYLIYIPFEKFSKTGGPTSFMKNLKGYLDENNISYLSESKSANDAKLIFFPVFYPPKILRKIKKNGGAVIQRLDGVYYPSKHGKKYEELNSGIKEIYLNYADFIIFQSEYSKRQCFEMFGEKPPEKFSIILNGVNKSLFYPAPSPPSTPSTSSTSSILSTPPTPSPKIKFITTGNFRNLDMLEPIVKALDMITDKLNFELIVAGPIENPELQNFLSRAYIKYIGDKSLAEVAQLLRECDIFIYSHLNPPCPNSVIEAISCGLPVVGFDSGAMQELLPFSKDLLAFVSDEIFQKYQDFDAAKLAEYIFIAAENFNCFKEKSLKNTNLYSFD